MTELYNANDVSLGKVPFLEKGYIIDTDDSPLGTDPILGKRRRWHIYTIKDNETIGVCSISDEKLEKVKKFLEGIQSDD